MTFFTVQKFTYVIANIFLVISLISVVAFVMVINNERLNEAQNNDTGKMRDFCKENAITGKNTSDLFNDRTNNTVHNTTEIDQESTDKMKIEERNEKCDTRATKVKGYLYQSATLIFWFAIFWVAFIIYTTYKERNFDKRNAVQDEFEMNIINHYEIDK